MKVKKCCDNIPIGNRDYDEYYHCIGYSYYHDWSVKGPRGMGEEKLGFNVYSCDGCNAIDNIKFCPYCGKELELESQ